VLRWRRRSKSLRGVTSLLCGADTVVQGLCSEEGKTE
jgi:hypothetical protein